MHRVLEDLRLLGLISLSCDGQQNPLIHTGSGPHITALPAAEFYDDGHHSLLMELAEKYHATSSSTKFLAGTLAGTKFLVKYTEL